MDGMAGGLGGSARRLVKTWPRRLRPLLPEIAVILGFIAMIWGAVAIMLWQARLTAVESARQQTATLAGAYAESTARIATVLDRHLLALRAAVQEKGARFDLRDWLVTQSSPDPLTAQISIADAAGQIVWTTMPDRGRGVSIGDRPHFRAHLDDGMDRLFISAPVTGRVSGRCSVQFSRRVSDPAGGFAGVAVISLACDDLSTFYGSDGRGGGFVMVAGLDGVIRGYGPARPDLLGTDLRGEAAVSPILSEREGTLDVVAPWDDEWRIMSFQRLPRYPLTVVAGFNAGRVFRQYQPVRDRAIEIAAAVTAVILLMGAVWIRQRVRLAASRRALLVTLDHMSQGILMIDEDRRVPVVNRRAVDLLDLPEALLAPRRAMLWSEADELGLDESTRDTGPTGIEIHKNGRIIETMAQTLPGGGLVRTFTDVTERRIADARIRHMAHHDPLTGLANRGFLTASVTERIKHADSEPFGLICFDLDGFKAVNDMMGHDASDRLLIEVAHRLRVLAGGESLLARMGGDQFAVLCAGGPQPGATERMAAAMVAAMDEPLEIDGAGFRLSASLGFAFYPDDATGAEMLIRDADTALYQAKSRGRGHVIRYDPAMDRTRRERIAIERDLRDALRDDALEVWFQPRFETRPSGISGFEALVRWRHPERGFISPAVFVPIAEQCGLIADLGMVVLRDAAAFAASLPSGRIAVNLSPVQFLTDNLPEQIAAVLDANHLTPDRLELEVTEGVLIADETQALAILTRLHDRGLQLALDDFGTGYASLSYLRRFPFDRIKIDQSFVQAQEHDATTRAIVESIMTMAHRLNLEVTAEGVETERQLNLLVSQGCPELQGYHLGRPMPAWEARAFFTNQHEIAQARLGVPERSAA